MVQSSSAQHIILQMLNEKFNSNPKYKEEFHKVLITCTDIPAVYDEITKEKFKQEIFHLKELLLSFDIPPQDLAFLDDQVEMYDGVNLVEERSFRKTEVPKDDLVTMEHVTQGKEGTFKFVQAYSWEQNKVISNYIFNSLGKDGRPTNRLCFFITPEVILRGIITSKIYDTPQDVEVIKIYESLKEDKESGEYLKRICFLGEALPTNKYREERSLSAKFYIYRFISEFQEEFFILHSQDIPTGEYTFSGTYTQIRDNKKITDTAKLSTKLPYLFVHTATKRIATYKNINSFFSACELFNINQKTIFEFPFLNPQDEEHNIMLNPIWYKWMLWAWLCHTNSGEAGFQKYPLHMIILGEAGSGKSSVINNMHANTCEFQNIFMGSGSTIKKLMPSFRENIPKPGYLAESNRFAYVDELFKLLTRDRMNTDAVDELFAMMNEILEHQKRTVGSGNSSINIKMTSRVIANSNYYKGCDNMSDLTKHISHSWLGRWLIYFQNQEHVDLIKNNTSELNKYEHLSFLESFKDKDFTGILDFLHSFKANYSKEKVLKIYSSMLTIMDENEAIIYKSRHRHHIMCLIDGLVKARCMMEGDRSFMANKDDYKRLKRIWRNVILSWKGPCLDLYLTPKEKLAKMPELSQILYDYIETHTPFQGMLKDYALKQMGLNDYRLHLMYLQEKQLVYTDEDGCIQPYHQKNKKVLDYTK